VYKAFKNQYFRHNQKMKFRLLDGIRLLLLLLVLVTSPSLIAATFLLPASIGVNGTPFKDCSGAGPVYTCTKKVDIKGGNTVRLTSNVTLNISPEFKVSPGGNVDNNGFVFNVSVTGKIHIDGTGTVLMDNLTATGNITIHKQANLTGNVVSTAGDITISDGNNTITGNIDALTGSVDIEDGNNFIDGNITANGGAGPLNIDGTSIVSGTCDPIHPQCNGGGGGPGPGPVPACTTVQIAADGEEFRGISGTSDSDIFAVGHDGSIYHYDGITWSKTFDTGEQLHRVQSVAPNLAYTVGHDGEVFEFDGITWTNLPAPTGEDLNDVWAISSSEVWVVGKKEALYLWNGASWQDMSGGGQANVDNNQELRGAWGDAIFFYALEKDGDLYRYSRTAGPWSKIGACNAAFDMDVRDIWGDGAGNVYIAGKDKGANPDEAAVFLYNEGSNSCSKVFGTTTENNLEGISGNGSTVYAVGKSGLVLDNSSGAWSESTQGPNDLKDVWVSSSGTAYYAGKNGFVTTCNLITTTLDHFNVIPATTTASTCLPNAITIIAADASNNPLTDYTDQINISVSTNHGNWSVNNADNVTSPNPDNDDDGNVIYSFVLSDAGEIVLDLTNTHAEFPLVITVSDPLLGVSSSSVAIGFSDNVFVITEDPIQVAGRPQAMNVAMWTNDGSNCLIDTSYNYAAHNLEASINRGGVLAAAADPAIGAVTIPDGLASTSISLDFSVTPGQANFILDSSDVGQYRLTLSDFSNIHGTSIITGAGALLTLRPFGIAVVSIMAGATLNPGGSAPADAIFTAAGNNFEATVAGVLWAGADDANNDGVLDSGVYADNAVAPSYAWDTTLSVSALGFTPATGVLGSLNNGAILQAEFGGGSFNVTDLQYTEVGSFTLQSQALNFLGVPGLNIGGDNIIVGRFTPASLLISTTIDGSFVDANVAGMVPFTYIGQRFSYDPAAPPSFVVSALNAAAAVTQNYTGVWAKLSAGSVTFTAPSADKIQLGSDTATLMAVTYTQDAADFNVNDLGGGMIEIVFTDDDFVYDKDGNSEVPPFSPDIDLLITDVTDTDAITTAGSASLTPDGSNVELRFGRLRMENAFGSELTDLIMNYHFEYYDVIGITPFWTRHDDADTTIVAPGDINAVPGNTAATTINPSLLPGKHEITLSAPLVEVVETITNLVDSSGEPWLQYDWDGDGLFDNNPSALATFGIFNGDPVQIYIQQIYQ
jgi:hypothetical protein